VVNVSGTGRRKWANGSSHDSIARGRISVVECRRRLEHAGSLT
jgi:hypothetical protein